MKLSKLNDKSPSRPIIMNRMFVSTVKIIYRVALVMITRSILGLGLEWAQLLKVEGGNWREEKFVIILKAPRNAVQGSKVTREGWTDVTSKGGLPDLTLRWNFIIQPIIWQKQVIIPRYFATDHEPSFQLFMLRILRLSCWIMSIVKTDPSQTISQEYSDICSWLAKVFWTIRNVTIWPWQTWKMSRNQCQYKWCVVYSTLHNETWCGHRKNQILYWLPRE